MADQKISQLDQISVANPEDYIPVVQAGVTKKGSIGQILNPHAGNLNNPHQTTKAQIGLENVDNTSDSEKPVSNPQSIVIGGKVSKTGDETIAGTKTFDNNPIIPAPSLDMHPATKKYVDDTKSSIQSKQIIAGLGLTGGGDLTTDKTLNIVSLNDGIIVNADNIQLDTQDSLISTSSTKPLSANQGKILNDSLTENIEPALAEIINQLNSRIKTLEEIIKNMLFKSGQFDTLNVVKTLNIYGGTNMILTGTSSPSIVPEFVGQVFINTTAGTIYQSKGNASSSDWKQTSN